MTKFKGKSIKYKNRDLFVMEEKDRQGTKELICYYLDFNKRITNLELVFLEMLPDGRFKEIDQSSPLYSTYVSSFLSDQNIGNLDSITVSERKLQNYYNKLNNVIIGYGAQENQTAVLKFTQLALRIAELLLNKNNNYENQLTYLNAITNLASIYRDLQYNGETVNLLKNGLNHLESLLKVNNDDSFIEYYQDFLDRIIQIYLRSNNYSSLKKAVADAYLFYDSIPSSRLRDVNNYYLTSAYQAEAHIHFNERNYEDALVAMAHAYRNLNTWPALLNTTFYQERYSTILFDLGFAYEQTQNYENALKAFEQCLDYTYSILESKCKDAFILDLNKSIVDSFKSTHNWKMTFGRPELAKTYCKDYRDTIMSMRQTVNSQ